MKQIVHRLERLASGLVGPQGSKDGLTIGVTHRMTFCEVQQVLAQLVLDLHVHAGAVCEEHLDMACVALVHR